MNKSLRHVLAILLAAIPAVAADSVSGKWQIHQSIVGNESDLSCTLTQTGDDLSGTCDSPTGAVKISGKVSETKVTWTFQSEYNGSPLTMKYSGTMASPTKMTGIVSVDPYNVEGEFTATAAK
ncbi:MAG TPA: hypothetical protein VMJ75_19900 [Candidatus Acidoferrales bacterium]|nr:hypothetical protein [Candidatus Acidoferrales bacterium]